MTDVTGFYRTVVTEVREFVSSYENLRLLRDRIAADSFLSGQAATAAQAGGRADLSAADFDNFKVAVDLLDSLLAKTNGGDVPVSINTGGAVKLAFYRII